MTDRGRFPEAAPDRSATADGNSGCGPGDCEQDSVKRLVTPLSRRDFLHTAGLAGAGSLWPRRKGPEGSPGAGHPPVSRRSPTSRSASRMAPSPAFDMRQTH